MSLHSISISGLRLVDQIPIAQSIQFQPSQNGLDIVNQLLATKTPGAPVIDSKGKFIGFISEFDVLTALESGRDISELTAEEIMMKDQLVVSTTTTIAEAVRIMKKNHVLVLPVEKEGRIVLSRNER